MEMSLREYSRHRGVSHVSVLKAIKAGRIEIARTVTKGKKTYSFVDSDKADQQWADRTDASYQRVATRGEMGKGAQGPKKTRTKPAPADPAPAESPSAEPPPAETPKATSLARNSFRPGGEIYDKSRAAREAYSARLMQLEYKQKTGELVSLDKVKLLFFNTARNVQQNLLSIPNRISAIIAAENDPKKIHDLLSHEIKVAMRELSDGNLPQS